MLDIKYIRDNKEAVKKNCKNRGASVDIEFLLNLYAEFIGEKQILEGNEAMLKKQSKAKPTEYEIIEQRKLGDTIQVQRDGLKIKEEDYLKILKLVPNMTHPDAPLGTEIDFKVLTTEGNIPQFRNKGWFSSGDKFQPKDHEELMLTLDVIDFERGAKTTGAKFYFTKNELVLLNNALIQYGIDILRKHSFVIMETPDIVKNEILSGVGFVPRGPESNTYALEETDLSLIATAEIPLGGYHSNEKIDLSKGPLKYAGISHCFRKEAGTYGKASKGLYRVHQFTKLEMFVYCKPEDSNNMHEELLAIEREIVDGLGIPYRVIDTASQDLGAPAYRKFDIEAWMVMNQDYSEITSTSNCTDYQARRLGVRYRDESGKTRFAHTLNGTAVVTSRFPIAIFENFQQKDGSIKIPKVLQKYCGFKEIKSKK